MGPGPPDILVCQEFILSLPKTNLLTFPESFLVTPFQESFKSLCAESSSALINLCCPWCGGLKQIQEGLEKNKRPGSFKKPDGRVGGVVGVGQLPESARCGATGIF